MACMKEMVDKDKQLDDPPNNFEDSMAELIEWIRNNKKQSKAVQISC